MCPAGPPLLVLLLIAASSAQCGYAQQAIVKDPAQLRAALSDAAVGTIVLPQQVSLGSSVFQPVTVARPIVMASDGAYGCLDFGNTSRVLLSVGPGGNMTLQGLTVRSFYPAQPLQVTPASSIMPISAVDISRDSAELHVESCVFHVHGQLKTVTGPMPFWSTILQAASKAAGSTQQQVAPVSAQMSFFGGNSSVTVRKSMLAIDPSGCYTGQGHLTWDSSSLWTAVQQPAVTHAVVFVNISLSPQQFSPLVSSPVGNMTISGCSGTALDFNQLHSALVMQQGATLQLMGPLQLLGAATAYHSSGNSSNSSALLLLGSVDILSGARLLLQDVEVGVSDSSSVLQAMQLFTQASGATAPAVMQQLPAATGQRGPSFVVQSWDIDLSGATLPQAGVAAHGTRLTLQNVTVFQAVQSCFPAGSNPAIAPQDGKLKAFLMDQDITAIHIERDMTLHGEDWQAQSSEDIVDISRPVEIRGCHPNAASGGRYTLDFSELQGTTLFNLHSILRVSGDLVLKGLPDREGSPGSWMLMPFVNLASDQAALVVEDVLLTSKSASPLHADSTAWQSAGGVAAAARTWSSMNSSMSVMQQVKVTTTTAAKLFPACFGNTNHSDSTRRRLLQAAMPTSSNSSDGSYYGYINTQLYWDASLIAKPRRSVVDVAPLVLGLLLGLVLVAAVAATLLRVRRRRRRMLQYQQHEESKHGPDSESGSAGYPGGACCWKQPWRKDIQLQRLAANGTVGQNGSVYTATDSHTASWVAADGPGQVHEIPVLSSITNFDTSGVLGPVGSVENSRHGPLVFPPRPLVAPQNHYGGPLAGGSSLQVSALPSPRYRELVDATHIGQYESKLSGGLDIIDCLNSVHPATITGGGYTTDGNTTITSEGTGGAGGLGVGVNGGQHKQHKQQVFEDARRRLGAAGGDLARSDALVLESVLGEGTFGKVFKGYWKGTLVAVKTMMFPAAMSGKEKREKMAIMETAISASLSHPNIVQMYTYYLRPVLVGHEATLTCPQNNEADRLDRSSVGDSTMNAAFLNEGLSDSVHSWEVQLVLEYCDQGSLRSLLNKKGAFTQSDGIKDMVLIVDTALDVARAMLHLHSENIIHSDLKARNILLKSSGGADGQPFVAKVADFGLSMRIDPNATHVSNVYQGTMTHMAPEVMLQGKLSRGSDVYAFGVLLWELYSGGHAFKGVPRALLGHEVAHKQRRPEFPEGSPFEYQLLACRCWESDVSIRPSFQEILLELQRMKERLAAAAASTSATQPSSDRTSNATPASHSRATPQQQRLTGNSGPLSPVLHSVSQEAGVAVQGSKAANGGAAGAPGAGNLQEQAVVQEQQQQHLQQLSADAAVAYSGNGEGGPPIGRTVMQQTDAFAAADDLQQQQQQQWDEGQQQLGQAQQRHPQRLEHGISKEVTPDNLQRQLSATVATGDSIGSPGPLAAAVAGAAGGLGAAAGYFSANSADSPPHNQHNDSSMHRQARDSGAGKSVYISDPFESTTDEFHPRFVLYGAGAHLRQRGIFWPDSVTSSDAQEENADDQSPPATPAAADSAAAAVSGAQAFGPQVAAASALAVDATGTAATVPDSQRVQYLVASDEAGMQQHRLQQQQQQQSEIQQECVIQQQQRDPGHLHLSQSQQHQEQVRPPGIKRLTSAAAAAARKLWQSSSSASKHTAAPAAVAAAPAPKDPQGMEALQSSLAGAAGGPVVEQQQGVATAALQSAAVIAAPSNSIQQQQQRRSPSLDAGSSRRTSSSSRRSAEISNSNSNRSIDMAGISAADNHHQQQQMVQLVPVIHKHLQQIEEGSSGEPSLQKMPSVVAQLKQSMNQQQHQQQAQQGQVQQEQPHVIAQLQQRLQQQQLQQVPAQEQLPRVRFQAQHPEGAGPSMLYQQQPLHQQQQPPGLQQRSTLEPFLRSTDDNNSSSSGSISHSSSGLAPTSDSSPSRSRTAHSGSAAAIAAVMSLKAALAKRAMAERTSKFSPAVPAAGGIASARSAQSVASTVPAAAPVRSGPAGFSAVGQAADAARQLQQQHQQLSGPLPVLGPPAAAGAAAAAGGGGVVPYSSFTARRSLQVGPTLSGAATPFALGPPVTQTPNTATTAAAAAAGRYSLDARAKSVSAATINREHHRLAPRAVASARGAFPGVTAPLGNPSIAGVSPLTATAGDSAVSSASASPVPAKPKFSFHRAVRKALSARDLGSGTRAAAAAAAAAAVPLVPVADTRIPVSDPTAATSFAGDVSLAQQLQQQQQQQQQPKDPQQLQLQQVQWLEQAASAGSTNSQDPALAALAPDQLQQLAQIADAAKAQVSFELPLPQPTRSAVCGPTGSFSAPGAPAPPPQYPMSHTLFASTGQSPSVVAGPALAGQSAAATGLSGQFAVTIGASISDPTSHQVPAHLLPPPRHWGGYLGPSIAGPSSRAADMAGRNSLEQGASIPGPQAAGCTSLPAPATGRFSLDTRKGHFSGGAGGGPGLVSPSGNVLRYATQQRPVGEQAEHSSIYRGQASPGQEAAYLAAPGPGFIYSSLGPLGHAQGRGIPTGRVGTKPRRASAPLQHPAATQRERRRSALQSIVDHEVVVSGVGGSQSVCSVGSAGGAGRSRRASAPAQKL